MKLLICDDDISTVGVLEHQIPWPSLGISRILQAYNGEAAIQIAVTEKPELILCDIGMPRKNGLDVLKYIRQQGLDSEFCFLTCYDDFACAKEAIRYGVSAYITKPFELGEVEQAVREMIAAHQKKARPAQPPEPQLRRDSLINSTLRQISDGIFGNTAASVDAALRRSGVGFSAESRWMMAMSCTDSTDALKLGWDRDLLMYTVGRLHDETLLGYIGSAYTLTNWEKRFILCVCFIPEGQCSREALMQRCEQLAQICGTQTGTKPSVLVGGPFPLYRSAEIKTRMVRCMDDLRIYAGRCCTLPEVEAQQRERKDFLDGVAVLQYLKRQDCDGFTSYMRTVTRRIASSGEYTREVLDSLRREVINAFLPCLRDNGVTGKVLFEDGTVAALAGQCTYSAEHMVRFASALFQRTLQLLRSSGDEDTMARAERYIRTHFMDNITREDVAAVACITPNYLSKQFHSKKGMNLREYINTIRIEEAKRLLLTTSHSVSDVAGMVGYDNISYFSTVFRKYAGMSPVDWRSAAQPGKEESL